MTITEISPKSFFPDMAGNDEAAPHDAIFASMVTHLDDLPHLPSDHEDIRSRFVAEILRDTDPEDIDPVIDLVVQQSVAGQAKVHELDIIATVIGRQHSVRENGDYAQRPTVIEPNQADRTRIVFQELPLALRQRQRLSDAGDIALLSGWLGEEWLETDSMAHFTEFSEHFGYSMADFYQRAGDLFLTIANGAAPEEGEITDPDSALAIEVADLRQYSHRAANQAKVFLGREGVKHVIVALNELSDVA